jgi:hypothetical protein
MRGKNKYRRTLWAIPRTVTIVLTGMILQAGGSDFAGVTFIPMLPYIPESSPANFKSPHILCPITPAYQMG